jgi:hypothetical protein
MDSSVTPRDVRRARWFGERRQVRILAIAVKERNRLFIAGEEVKL